MDMLSSCICGTLISMCNERYSRIATGSVRKGIDILPHSSPLPRKQICTTLVVHVEGRTCLRADYSTYMFVTLHNFWKLGGLKVPISELQGVHKIIALLHSTIVQRPHVIEQ